MATILSLTIVPTIKADNVKPAISMTVPKSETSSQVAEIRIKEIKETNNESKKMTKKESRETKRNNRRDGGVVYIGTGTLILIIILILILV